MPASHPARGAWIEIAVGCTFPVLQSGRTPQGVRGLKCASSPGAQLVPGRRTPQGVRGLKLVGLSARLVLEAVAPRKGCVD